jgi:hypothetical protein
VEDVLLVLAVLEHPAAAAVGEVGENIIDEEAHVLVQVDDLALARVEEVAELGEAFDDGFLVAAEGVGGKGAVPILSSTGVQAVIPEGDERGL